MSLPIRNIARWVLLLGLIGLGLLYLNGAMFAVKMTYGPPTDYPNVWAHVGWKRLGYGFTLIALAVIFFLALRKGFRVKKSKTIIILVVLIVVVLALPYARRELLIDKCLDLGGRWDGQYYVCEKE